MKQIPLQLRRETCVPNPLLKNAISARNTIVTLGGAFYKFSINDCSNILTLERHLIKDYGLSMANIIDAFNKMAETQIPERKEKLKELWGVVESIDGVETTSFIGFAFTNEELENKSKLFVTGVQILKKHLETAIKLTDENMLKKAMWDI